MAFSAGYCKHGERISSKIRPSFFVCFFYKFVVIYLILIFDVIILFMMKTLLKTLFLGIFLLVLVIGSFAGGAMAAQMGYLPRIVPASAAADAPTDDMSVFWEAWRLIRANYVDRTAVEHPDRLAYAAIRGVTDALGDTGHTRFLTPDEANAEHEHLDGKFFGIGAYLGVDDQKRPFIITPFAGSPAEKAGIRAGDVILQVDGVDVTGMSLDEVVSRIKGEKGTEVTLTILHENETTPQDITVVRDEIKIPAVDWAFIPDTKIAFIRLNQFSGVVNEQMVEAIQAAKAEGATALIVDVRMNGGGLLDQAIKVSSQFLVDGDVLQEKNAKGDIKRFAVEKGGIAPDIPLVVLVDKGTASAAEIFAGAIQDHGRGTVIGETTFGTGTVLTPYTLSDGSMLLLGTSEWLTPNGREIWRHGITPDKIVELSAEQRILVPMDVKEMTGDEFRQAGDAQLLAAVKVLRGE